MGDWLAIDVHSFSSFSRHYEVSFRDYEVSFRGSLFSIDRSAEQENQLKFVFTKKNRPHCGRVKFSGDIDSFVNWLAGVAERGRSISLDVEYSVKDHRSFPVFVWSNQMPGLVSWLIVDNVTGQWVGVGIEPGSPIKGFFPSSEAGLLTLPDILAKIELLALSAPERARRWRQWIESTVMGNK